MKTFTKNSHIYYYADFVQVEYYENRKTWWADVDLTFAEAVDKYTKPQNNPWHDVFPVRIVRKVFDPTNFSVREIPLLLANAEREDSDHPYYTTLTVNYNGDIHF